MMDAEGREGAETASEEIARLRSKLAGARHLLFVAGPDARITTAS
jgi:hypothetical protein